MNREKILETLMEWFDAGMIMYENLPKLADEILSSSQWVSVEDRLPKKYQRLYGAQYGKVVDDIYYKDGYFWGEGIYVTKLKDITHWQKKPPLPTPPED